MTTDRFQDWLYRYPFLQNVVDLKNILMNVGHFKVIPLRSESLKSQPFFIVGSGRSGNTLLRRLLTEYEGIVIPPETYVLGKLIRLHNAHRSMPWGDYVNLMLSTIEYFPEFSTFEIASLSPLAVELKKIPEKDRSLARVVDAFYRYYAREKGLDLVQWGDKTPLNAMHVFRIRNLFPKARFIHIVRDGVDVAHSYVNAGFFDNHTKAANRWVKSVTVLNRFSSKYPDQCQTLRYETLVSDTDREISAVVKFLSIDQTVKNNMTIAGVHETGMSGRMLSLGDVEMRDHHENVRKPVTTEFIGKGRRELSPEVLSELAPILNRALASLGYETIG